MVKKSILILLAFSSLSASQALAGHLVGSGCSVSTYGYLSDLAIEYERRTGVNVAVRGGGTVLGIEDLRTGAVDFAAACRGRDKADPDDVDFIQVAWDALVFIIHKSNPVENISLEQIRQIYAGKITNWKQLGGADLPITILDAKPGRGLSGINASLLNMVLEGNEPAKTSRIVRLSSTGIVEQTTEKTSESFAAAGYSSSRKRNVKMLRLDGVPPSHSNIMSKTYGLTRPLFIIVPKKPKPEVKRFVDFVLSKEGQNFIRSQHVVSLDDMK